MLLTHAIITLGYPAARAFVAERNKLQLFTDAMTITGMVLIIGGLIYSFVLHGDFDIGGFVMKRGFRRVDDMANFGKYKAKQEAARMKTFNYPLFLGILYLIISAVIAYGFL